MSSSDVQSQTQQMCPVAKSLYSTVPGLSHFQHARALQFPPGMNVGMCRTLSGMLWMVTRG